LDGGVLLGGQNRWFINHCAPYDTVCALLFKAGHMSMY